MTQLEQTIIANAKRELAVVLVYYGQKAAGTKAAKGEDAWLEYLGHYNSLNALLSLAHQAESGLSEEGTQALLDIEAQHTEAYRIMAS
jgi:hypothetical protein